MFSASFFWVLDSGWGQIGGKGVLNLGDVEGTKILRNEEETSVAAIVLVFRLQATELTCQGRVLAGIRGWVLGPRFGKGSLDFSSRVDGLFSQRLVSLVRLSSTVSWSSCDIPRRQSNPARTAGRSLGASAVLTAEPHGTEAASPWRLVLVYTLSPLLCSSSWRLLES